MGMADSFQRGGRRPSLHERVDTVAGSGMAASWRCPGEANRVTIYKTPQAGVKGGVGDRCLTTPGLAP